MPKFSVVVPSYGNARYLTACLNSIEAQSFGDWEAVVVDDASVDGSLEIAREHAKRDCRIRVIEKTENGGRHLARMSGVEASSGEYLMFLDADDEFLPGLLSLLDEKLSVDPDVVVHFGIETAPTEGMSKWEADAFFESANEPCGELSGNGIVETVFCKRFGFRRDWRITQRVFPAAIAKTAFSKMKKMRMQGAEDGYEYFVLACNESREITANEIRGYLYRIGRGSTNERMLDLDGFSSYARSMFDCEIAARDYAELNGVGAFREPASDFGDGLLETLMTDWHERVNSEQKEAAARFAASLFGRGRVAEQLFRIVRDDAYALWDAGGRLKGDEPFLAWLELADEFKAGSGDESQELSFETQARSHVSDLRNRTKERSGQGLKSLLKRLVRRLDH